MAAALSAAGHNVWWDQALKSGEVYDQVTESALRQARIVIVLWSKAAVASDWVRSEATVAMQRGALMPVMIEACQRPVMFELRQSADLITWKGNAKDPRLVAFLADVGRQLATPETPRQTQAPALPTSAGPSRRMLIGGGAALALAGAGGFSAWRSWAGRADDGTASVVVLPFANLSGDPAQAYFSDGLAEELRAALSQVPGLNVIGRTSSEKFRDATDLADVAAQLGVANVLTGSVRRSPTTIRINAQLVDSKTGTESWSQSFDRPAGDVLAVQSSIATSVVGALSSRLGKATGTVVVGGTSNPQAQALYLEAAAVDPVDEADARKSLALLNSAIALDPNYALAYARRANIFSRLSGEERDFASARLLGDKALASARRAVDLAPNSGRALANYATFLLGNLDGRGAFAAAQRALQVEPGSVDAVGGATRTIFAFDPKRAEVLASEVIARDPFNERAYQGRAQALFNLRRYADALTAAQKANDLSNGSRAGRQLNEALVMLGRFPEARQRISSLPASLGLPQAALIETRAGNRAAADAALAGLETLDPRLTAFGRAQVHAQRGETAAALDALESAVAAKDFGLANIAFNPFLDPIRREPRFKAVQDKIIPPELLVRSPGR
jgi:serine/threonine-protein kinase